MYESELNEFDARQFIKKRKPAAIRRVCCLTRVSTLHEQQTNALENQNEWIADLVKKHKGEWTFDIEYDLYVDRGISGTGMKKRTEFNDMIAKCKAGKYDLIVTREVSRFMRNAALTLSLVNDLADCGVEVYFVNDGIWTFRREDYFKLTIMASYAQQESEKISERVFSGQAISRKKGTHYGTGNILGYDLYKPDAKSSERTTYILNEEQAKTVRLIYSLCLQGKGMKKIKYYLEEHGYKTAKGYSVWHVTTIQHILRNYTYTGSYEYMKSVTIDPLTHKRVSQLDRDKRQRKEGKFPAIIDIDTWEEAQKQIDSNMSHGFNKDGKEYRRGMHKGKNIYCHKMRCSCGRRFRFDMGRKADSGVYRCYSFASGDSRKIREQRGEIDNCIEDGIIDWKLDLFTVRAFQYLSINVEEVKKKVHQVIAKVYHPKEATQMSESQEKIEKDICDLEMQKSKLLDIFLDGGTLSKEEYQRKNKELVDKVQSLKNELNKVVGCESPVDSKQTLLKQVDNFVNCMLEFPIIDDTIIRVPEAYIETYIQSIKACKGNVFEFTINMKKQKKQMDESKVIIDNSSNILFGECRIGYEEAKAYANKLKRKVIRKQWETPVIIRVYGSMN